MASSWIRRAAAVLVAVSIIVGTSLSSAALTPDTSDPTWLSAYNACVQAFANDGLGQLVSGLTASQHDFTVVPSTAGNDTQPTGDKGNVANSIGTGAQIEWDSTDGHFFKCDGVKADPCATLYHELTHAAEIDTGTYYTAKCVLESGGVAVNTGIDITEIDATLAENTYRTKANLTLRTCYNGLPLPDSSDGCVKPSHTPPSWQPGMKCVNDVCVASDWGDPHLTTFDGATYDLQAVGELVLVRSTSSLDGPLEVQVRQAPAEPGQRLVAVTTAVAANVNGDQVGVYLGASGVNVHVNMTSVQLPVSLSGGGLVSLVADGAVDVLWPDGTDLVVHPLYPAWLSLSMGLAPEREGAVEGVLGDYDGDPSNDLSPQGGAALTQPVPCSSLPAFVNSWRVTQSTSLFDYAPGESTMGFTDTTFPDGCSTASGLSPAAYAAAQSVCQQAGVYDPAALNACILDVASTGQAVFAFDAAALQSIRGTNLSITTAGAKASLLFYGSAGQAIFVDAPFSSFPPGECASLTLNDPNNVAVPGAATCVIDGSGYIGRTNLSVSGLYSLVLSAEMGGTGDMRVMVIAEQDQAGSIVVNGPPVTTAINVPGAVARLSFPGTAGQMVSVDVLSSALQMDDCGPSALQLVDPSNTPLETGCIINAATGAIAATLPTSGQYTLVISPTGTLTGQVTVQIHN